MSDEKKSIFDLAEKFDYQSPFNDWLRSERYNQNSWEAEIVNIQVIPDYGFNKNISIIAPPSLKSSTFIKKL